MPVRTEMLSAIPGAQARTTVTIPLKPAAFRIGGGPAACGSGK